MEVEGTTGGGEVDLLVAGEVAAAAKVAARAVAERLVALAAEATAAETRGQVCAVAVRAARAAVQKTHLGAIPSSTSSR